MELVNGQGTPDKTCAEDRGVDGNQLPHGRVIVGKDLELGVEVEVQVDKAGKGGGRVARRHGLEAVVDSVSVSGADLRRVIDLLEPGGVVASPLGAGVVGGEGDIRLAHGQEMRPQTADQPFDKYLEDGGSDQGVEETDDGVVDIPERANADLHDEEDKDRHEGGEQRSGPDGDDLLAKGVGELGVDDLSIGEEDGERAGWRRVGFVDLNHGPSPSVAGLRNIEGIFDMSGDLYDLHRGRWRP